MAHSVRKCGRAAHMRTSFHCSGPLGEGRASSTPFIDAFKANETKFNKESFYFAML